MKIEVGKKYKSRGGAIFEIIEDYGNEKPYPEGLLFPFVGVNENGYRTCFTEYGQWLTNTICDIDLIAEAPTPTNPS